MYLLDTHTFLWYMRDDARLPSTVKNIIEYAQDVRVSIGVFWEMAIKSSTGKLWLPVPVTNLMDDCKEYGFAILPIKASHLERLKELPRIHGDPFDRLYVCQAQSENLALITKDTKIARYDVRTLW